MRGQKHSVGGHPNSVSAPRSLRSPSRGHARAVPNCSRAVGQAVSGYATDKYDEEARWRPPNGPRRYLLQRIWPTSRPPDPQPAGDERARSDPRDDIRAFVPRTLLISAALGWRLLVVAAALAVIGTVVAYLAAVVVPVAIALLLAAVLSPAVSWLARHHVPRAPATALVMVGGLAGLGGVLTFVIITFVRGLPELGSQLSTSVDTIVTWLTTGPLQLSDEQLRGVQDEVLATLSANQSPITVGALTTAATVGEMLTELLLVVFTLIFFLHSGQGIWEFLLSGAPAEARTRAAVAGRRGLAALVSYIRATAVVDAVAIGIGLAVLRIPLAVPLAALVFLGAFVPIIGAVVTGSVAVLIALVAQGPVSALIVLAIIVGIAQLEGHVLQPLLLGRAVKLHPLAVVLAIAAGLLTAGIAGALLAVPLLAVLNSGIRSLRSDADRHTRPRTSTQASPRPPAPTIPTWTGNGCSTLDQPSDAHTRPDMSPLRIPCAVCAAVPGGTTSRVTRWPAPVLSATPLALLTVDELDELTRVAAGRAIPADATGVDAVHALEPVLVLDHHPRRHGVVRRLVPFSVHRVVAGGRNRSE
jgi:predicted PurR-regulated permease PerM